MATKPLGFVTWPDGEIVATLHVDGHWECAAEPENEPILKALFSDTYKGPSEGPFGPGALRQLAAMVKGTATVHPRPGPPAGTVY